jgi:hypothetical protein
VASAARHTAVLNAEWPRLTSQVATNVETLSQAQPADFTCAAYHAVLAALRGTPAPNCSFVVPHRFIGTCSCTPAEAEAGAEQAVGLVEAGP